VPIERLPKDTRPRRSPRWLWILGLCVLAALIIGIVILATKWPFTRDAIVRAIHEATSRQVEIGAFKPSYFPPGCVAENVRVLHQSDPSGTPLITIERLTIQGSFTGMFTSPKRLAQVKVAGMRIVVPPEGSPQRAEKFAFKSGGDSLEISKIAVERALLEFVPSEADDEAYRLGIDSLTLDGVGSGKPWSYRAQLTNTKPPGVIRAAGRFGPWNADDPGAIPTSGEYTYNDVDLGVFRGISGTLQAKGKFSGPLARIETDGAIEVPNFHVDKSGSTVPMKVDYHAIVNGTNGETYLDPVEARFFRTTLVARGPIADETVTLDLSVPRGRIDDILRLFVEEKTSPLSGAVKLAGKFVWPPGERKFVEKIRLNLDFGVENARFRSEKTQNTIDSLSKSGQGQSKKEADADPRTMLSDLRGGVAFRNGVANFNGVSFTVPGASADIRGTYGLVDKQVNLRGILHTTGKLADTTSGFKAFVLKAISPFLKKKNQVKIVPFKITGTFKDAKVGLD
jgi:hypothetical protein